jgi:hypothetical protein
LGQTIYMSITTPRDHDPERGDLFREALPQIQISQGSSSGDRRIIRALVEKLAAMRP